MSSVLDVTEAPIAIGISPPASTTVTILDVRVVTGTGGGADKTVLNGPRFLARHGYRNLCAYLRNPNDRGFGQLVERARRLEAPLLAVDDRGPFDFRAISSLLRICREENVAVWHGHEYKSNALGLLLRRYWPMRLVTTVHGWIDDTLRLRAYNCIDRWCLRHYEHVWCVSQRLYDQSLAAGVSASRCSRLDNGIDSSQYTRKSELAVAQERLGIPPGRKVVGAVGRLSREKGFDLLIHAIRALVQQGEKVHLVIAGEGPLEVSLRQLIRSLDAENYVSLLGFQENTLGVYEALDVFALSSIHEGMPNVMLEAMSVGVPVVATDVGAVSQIVKSEENGLICAAGSAESLKISLGIMLADLALQNRCSMAAREVIRKDYSFEARMDKVAAKFDRMLSEK